MLYYCGDNSHERIPLQCFWVFTIRELGIMSQLLKENKIVTFLIEAGPFDMNMIGLMPFSRQDKEQFKQLVGLYDENENQHSKRINSVVSQETKEVLDKIGEESGLTPADILTLVSRLYDNYINLDQFQEKLHSE